MRCLLRGRACARAECAGAFCCRSIGRRASKAGVVSIDDNGLDPGFIAGLLTQEVEPNNERLGIGVVTHAKYVLETIALLQDPKATSTIASSGEVEGAKAATAEDAARD